MKKLLTTMIINTSIVFIIVCIPILQGCASFKGSYPFSTDGCTDFPDGTKANKTLWLHCCVSHDSLYWKGGPLRGRKKADHALKECVAQTGHPCVANLMFVGVRVFATPLLATSWRWGYEWNYLHWNGNKIDSLK